MIDMIFMYDYSFAWSGFGFKCVGVFSHYPREILFTSTTDIDTLVGIKTGEYFEKRSVIQWQCGSVFVTYKFMCMRVYPFTVSFL